MQALLTLKAWIVSSAVWASLVGFLCWDGWPRLPLDVSATDPGTIAAHQSAVEFHLFQHGVLGFMPPVVGLAAGWLILQLQKRRNAAPPMP